MKLQIDRMIAKFFSSLPVDEQLNFSVAVTVMSVQRKWRQRMKAHKVCRPQNFVHLPPFLDIFTSTASDKTQIASPVTQIQVHKHQLLCYYAIHTGAIMPSTPLLL